MLFHIVLFRPRPSISDADRHVLFDALHTAATSIPSVRRFSIGNRVTHGRPYEQLMKENYAHAAVVEFDDLAGLKAYLAHPAHDVLGTKFMELLEVGLIYDYEVESIGT